MATIEEVFEAVGKIRLREKLPELIKTTQYEMVQKVIGQHKLGQLSTNAKIIPNYASGYYAKFKASLNSAPGYGTPDGHLTGAYDAELTVTVDATEYDIESGVDYAQNVSLTQYGDDFNRLSEQSKQEYCDEALMPAIADYINDVTGLKFN